MYGLFRASELSLLFMCAAWASSSPEISPPNSTHLPMVAVLDLEGRGVERSEAGVIADNIVANLQQSGRFRVMERSQINEILREQNFQQSGACDGSECAVQMGKVLGIDRMVVGSVGRVGGTYALSLRMVSVSTGEILRTTSRNRKGTIDEVLTDLVPLAVSDLTEERKKAVVWPWVAAGGAVVMGGGVAAAVLLSGGGSSSGSTSDAPLQDHLKFTW